MPANQLYLITLGELEFLNPRKGEPGRVPLGNYLIRTAKGRHILVDSGPPKALIGAKISQPWKPSVNVYIREEDNLVGQLSRLGLRPKDIDLLISSHFHFDHCGGHEIFAAAGVPSVVQRDHYDYAMEHSDRYDRELFDFEEMKYSFVDGDTEIDRGVVLVESTGHAIGHQSVYVETANGPVLLALDAIMWPTQAQTRELPVFIDDLEAAKRSIDKLMQFALEYRTYMIFGHDPTQWNTLPHAPRVFSR